MNKLQEERKAFTDFCNESILNPYFWRSRLAKCANDERDFALVRLCFFIRKFYFFWTHLRFFQAHCETTIEKLKQLKIPSQYEELSKIDLSKSGGNLILAHVEQYLLKVVIFLI